jgi:hypothetical protein
MAAEIR